VPLILPKWDTGARRARRRSFRGADDDDVVILSEWADRSWSANGGSVELHERDAGDASQESFCIAVAAGEVRPTTTPPATSSVSTST
jgi:hypothetical protein